MAQYLSTYHLKNLTVTSGVQYSYIFQPARGINATFLLLHGFPSSAYDWRYQVEDLTTAGYGVLVPDLLGHGKTVKPLSKEDYAYARQSEHLVELLKEEKLETVIGVGHDWGASLLARFMNYHPTYFSAGVFLSSPYRGLERVDLGIKDLDSFESSNVLTECRFPGSVDDAILRICHLWILAVLQHD